MDTEQTQQWETGSHNTEWGYVDTAAHTTHNTEHTQVRRSSRKHTDWRIAHSWRRGAAVSCRDRGRGGEGRHHNLDPYSRCKVAGHHLTSSSHFRIVGFHTDRGTMKPRLKMQITGLSGIFKVLTCSSVTEPGMWETRTEVGDGKDWWTVDSRHDISLVTFHLAP